MKRPIKNRRADATVGGFTGRDGAVDFIRKEEILHGRAGPMADDHIYRVIELVGTSEKSIEDAVHTAVERAHQSLLAAEGSDWFWWFGSDQESRNDAVFDELFRAHLRGAYQALDLEAPKSLDDSIVAHPVVWTFTHSVPTVRRRDQVSIRTNCPGRLTYRIDDSLERVETLVAVGGVMAGARRFQVTLGPFPASAQRLAFRFYCEHPGCQHESPCCLSGAQAIALGARARAPRRTSAHGSNTQPRGSHANHQ